MNLLIDLNNAHKFIHDLDVATILGDIDYIIKLVALVPSKQPSVFCRLDSLPIDIEEQKSHYADHIAQF